MNKSILPITRTALLTILPLMLVSHCFANEQFTLPPGYAQEIIADESTLDIFPGSDWYDMVTLNESGKQSGRYLYRTHEVRPSPLRSFDGGAVSVIDLHTRQVSLFAQRSHWEAVDGIVWTPWNSLLINEETPKSVLPDPLLPKAKRGHVYELFPDPENPKHLSKVVLRQALGSLSHEGIEYDDKGNIYVIDEDFEGGIYKFKPEKYGDLSSGQLYALKLDKNTIDRTGPARWIPLDMAQAILDANQAAKNVKASHWCRPEDLERIKTQLYVALTCHNNSINGQRRENRVLSISLEGKPVVSNFVQEGVNVPVEKNKIGFAKPDNLANGPNGSLWITEDNSPSEIWVAQPDDNDDGYADKVTLFATLKDRKAEATGIYFDKNYSNLYVNVQHAGDNNDKTVRIYKLQK